MKQHPITYLASLKERRKIANAVKRGAAKLDETNPGWFRKIKLSELNFCCECNCVYGQLDSKLKNPGAFIEAVVYGSGSIEEKYGYVVPDSARFECSERNNGYDSSNQHDLWLYEENLWRQAIDMRRKKELRELAI